MSSASATLFLSSHRVTTQERLVGSVGSVHHNCPGIFSVFLFFPGAFLGRISFWFSGPGQIQTLDRHHQHQHRQHRHEHQKSSRKWHPSPSVQIQDPNKSKRFTSWSKLILVSFWTRRPHSTSQHLAAPCSDLQCLETSVAEMEIGWVQSSSSKDWRVLWDASIAEYQSQSMVMEKEWEHVWSSQRLGSNHHSIAFIGLALFNIARQSKSGVKLFKVRVPLWDHGLCYPMICYPASKSLLVCRLP